MLQMLLGCVLDPESQGPMLMLLAQQQFSGFAELWLHFPDGLLQRGSYLLMAATASRNLIRHPPCHLGDAAELAD